MSPEVHPPFPRVSRPQGRTSCGPEGAFGMFGQTAIRDMLKENPCGPRIVRWSNYSRCHPERSEGSHRRPTTTRFFASLRMRGPEVGRYEVHDRPERARLAVRSSRREWR